MNSNFLLPLFLSLIPLVCWAITDVLMGVIGRSTKAIVGLFWAQFIGIFFLLPLFGVYSMSSPNWFLVALLGILPVFAWLFYMKATKVGTVAVASPISRTNFVIASVLGFLFLQEQITTLKILSIAAVLLGGIFLSLKKSSDGQIGVNKIASGSLYAFFSAIASGVLLFLLAILARANGWYDTTLALRVGVSAFAFLGLLGTSSKNEIISIKNPWLFIFLAALADIIGLSVYNIAVSRYDVSYVSVIASATALVTVMLARFYLNECLKMIQYAGVVLMVLGIIGLQIQWG